MMVGELFEIPFTKLGAILSRIRLFLFLSLFSISPHQHQFQIIMSQISPSKTMHMAMNMDGWEPSLSGGFQMIERAGKDARYNTNLSSHLISHAKFQLPHPLLHSHSQTTLNTFKTKGLKRIKQLRS